MPNKPTPPPGYSLEDVPDFLKPTAQTSSIVAGSPNGRDIAQVVPSRPNEVVVDQRDQFGQPQLNHEETHVFQLSRNPAVVRSALASIPSRPANDGMQGYKYGGTDGLLQSERQGKTIADFNMEQQAEMVRNYQQQSQEAIRKGDTKTLDALNAAYAPFLRQLAALPGKNDSMTTMTQKDLTPPAPGLPPSSVTGIMEPLPVMGGVARFLKKVPMPPKGYTLSR